MVTVKTVAHGHVYLKKKCCAPMTNKQSKYRLGPVNIAGSANITDEILQNGLPC